MKSKERLIVYPALALLFILVIVCLSKPLPDKASFRQVSIIDAEGKTKVLLSPWRGGGGMIRLYGPTENVRIKLSTVGDGGMIELFRSIGRRSVWLRAVDNGGLVRVFGWEGNDGVRLIGSKDGGTMSLFDVKGQTKAKLLIDENDQGFIELFGADGKSIRKFTAD